MSNIGERIKNLRLEVGMTQLELAEYVGYSGQVISNLERSYSNVKIEILTKISFILDASIDYITGNTPYRANLKTEDEQKLLLSFRNMSKQQRRILIKELEKK